jgi:cytoskeletal protein RodZ
MTDVGSQLRAGREAKGLTFEQAYKLTRIKAIYLEALEANQPDRSVPAKPIEPLHLPKISLGASRDTSSASPGGIPTTWLIAGAIVLFLLGMLLVLSALSSGGAHPAPTPAANIPMSVSASMAAPPKGSSTSGGPVSITVTADEHVWARVTLDGQTAFEGLMQPGASQTWQAADQIIVETGNAAALTVTYDGQSSVLGNRGQIVARAWGLGGSEDVPLAASTSLTRTGLKSSTSSTSTLQP